MRGLLLVLLAGCGAVQGALPDSVEVGYGIGRGNMGATRVDVPGGAEYELNDDGYNVWVAGTWDFGGRLRHAERAVWEEQQADRARAAAEEERLAWERFVVELRSVRAEIQANTAATYDAAGADVPPAITVNAGGGSVVEEPGFLEKHGQNVLLALGITLGLAVVWMVKRLLGAEVAPGGEEKG